MSSFEHYEYIIVKMSCVTIKYYVVNSIKNICIKKIPLNFKVMITRI